jgi:hypothetical protein
MSRARWCRLPLGAAALALALTVPTELDTQEGWRTGTSDGQAGAVEPNASPTGANRAPPGSLTAGEVLADRRQHLGRIGADGYGADDAPPAPDDVDVHHGGRYGDGGPIPGRAAAPPWRASDPGALVPGLAPRPSASDDAERLHPDRQAHLDGPTSPEGFRVAGGSSEAGEGTEVTYTVELDDTIDADLSELVDQVEAALYHPASWVNDHTLRRVDDPAEATIRVLLAAPATVDELCAQAGLDTNGIFSCWNGRFAALNAMRWEQGAAGFGDDLPAYRTYLVNHEFGHGLGYGHVGCPAPGTPAPIMMQQTRSTERCVPNGWPYPERAAHLTD